MNNTPLVTIIVPTYNHYSYVSQCLDNIFNQNVDFYFEVVVHDDASTDGTQEILEEYLKKYPKQIKLILQKENIYQKGDSIFLQYLPYLNGEYIAICEGDDYWSDHDKLKKQIQFLREHDSYVAIYHDVKVVNEYCEEIDDALHCYPTQKSHKFTDKQAGSYKLPGQTASLLYRNIWKLLDKELIQEYILSKGNGDHKIAGLLYLLGDIWYLGETLAVHRKIVTHGDSWSARNRGKNLSLFIYEAMVDYNKLAKKYFDKEVVTKKTRISVIIGSISSYLRSLSVDDKLIVKELFKINHDTMFDVVILFLIKVIKYPFKHFIYLFRKNSRRKADEYIT